MDGINGITAFYTLVSLGSISLLNNASRLLSPFFGQDFPENWESFLPGSLVGIIFLGVAVFAFFNARKKARTFAGDVGSVSMAFLLSWMMLSLIESTHSPFWVLFFSVYAIDAFVTIVIRIKRKENIFKPHRLHLYQLLANEKKWPHLKVAGLYAIIQLLINITTIVLYFKGHLNWPTFISIISLMITGYLAVRQRIVLSQV
jgi:UDP-GlcNAc:undecaprenyl-phosphate/decaprenyl-phosphate GlcNAc-1-phosphate transferase